MTGVLSLDGVWVYLGLFALSAGESSAFLGLVLPGETFVLAAGAAAGAGSLSLPWTTLVIVLGAIVGDTIGYALGTHFGGCRDHGLLGRVWSCVRMQKVRRFLARRGAPTIFLARFVGLLRPLAPFAAGAVRMPYRPFLTYNVAGGLVWGAGTVLAGYFVGTAFERVLHSAGLGMLAAVALGGLGLLALAKRRARSARGVEPPDDEPRHELGRSRVGEEVIGADDREKPFRLAGGGKDGLALRDRHHVVVDGVDHEQGPTQFTHATFLLMGGEVVEERRRDGEPPPADGDVGDAPTPDLGFVVDEQLPDVRR